LDAICFLLGISNLQNVRATSLQDLVYKSGQAGISKASVTVLFDNTDPDHCPIGYDKCKEISVTRQIIIGGANKNFINGKKAQNKAIQDLFCSVQLNVNNPNFLIMQGRVTKVLNMTPIEILSMIEEAAGTSVYEAKREKALSTIEKKDSKLVELTSLITDDIEPKLEKLRKDRNNYIEYQKICRDIDYLTRLYISYKYLQHKKSVESSETQIAKLNGEIQNNNDTIKAHETEALEIDEKIKEIQHIMDTVRF
jgi:structural maintenance of chromosome 2